MSRTLVVGCPVDSLDMNQTIEKIEETIKQKKICQHVAVNVSKFMEMRKDPHLKKIIEDCQIISADGMPLVWVSKLMGNPLPERVAGVDLFQELIKLCSEKGYRPFFFGAREWVVKSVVDNYKAKYPDLNVAGYRNGYYSKEEEVSIAKTIRESRADMLFVGFSSPMKEIFLKKWMPVMSVHFCMGVGGSFDIVAGKTKRAPGWMQKTGLEWLYRVIQEPRRMWKRYAKTNPAFVWVIFIEYMKSRRTASI